MTGFENKGLLACWLMLLISGVGPTLSAPPTTRPAEGLREHVGGVHALTNARIVIAPGRVVDRGTIVVRDGIIAAAGADVAAPNDARLWDLSGKTVYAGLIDAYSELAVDDNAGQQGAPYWNSQVAPQIEMAKNYKVDKSLNEKLRAGGITARLIAPNSRIIRGQSALVATGDDAVRLAMLVDRAAQHLRLTLRRRGRDEYPNSPMGAVALARQAFYDAQWYEAAWRAYNADKTLARPERNDALAALQPCLAGEQLAIADAANELFCLRADRFAREFSIKIALLGSGNEYRRLDAIAGLGRAVIVPLDFPKPPNVATAESAANVTLESMLHWDLAPENPARLDAAGVPIAFTSRGLKEPEEFLKMARKAVQRGLSADSALRAMTTTPAKILGAADILGTVESGRVANLVVTDGDLFADTTNVLETWVLGKRYEIQEEPSLDPRGDWRIETRSPENKPMVWVVRLNGEPDELKGTIRANRAKAGEQNQVDLKRVAIKGPRFSAMFDAKATGSDGVAQLSAVIVGEDSSQQWIGHTTWPNGDRSPLTASRMAAVEPESNDDERARPDPVEDRKAAFAVNYPLGAFGVDQPPSPAYAVIRNATVWTCDKNGVMQNAAIVVRNGKIIAVGSNESISTPRDAVEMDASGKHITPGIIDCHSHMATDGGVNESAQAITAEVRIGDFINSDDISIYRQLAGGVTSSNILHGSANPIGGQNQVIKLRWGALPADMKFAEAPAGIKFALGENVKQSNWGDQYTTRYPQTRMGVEQIVIDEFQAALAYRQQWDRWNATHQGLPPRRDLELEAIVEILEGRRWVHCHSYRQDEILALIRTLDGYGVTIGTFQHILEGYKVADAMARHGAMGSAFSDWWAYKFEVYDAIPYNGSLMHNAGVVVSFNSDDQELGRHLNHEAAKAVKYGGVPEEEALKFVTLNPAKQLRIDQHVGSITAGKHADFVVWSGRPLSTFSRCEQTWIDGRKYFDIEDDHQRRKSARTMRAQLIQKILASGETMRKEGDNPKDPAALWPCTDLFCRRYENQR